MIDDSRAKRGYTRINILNLPLIQIIYTICRLKVIVVIRIAYIIIVCLFVWMHGWMHAVQFIVCVYGHCVMHCLLMNDL